MAEPILTFSEDLHYLATSIQHKLKVLLEFPVLLLGLGGALQRSALRTVLRREQRLRVGRETGQARRTLSCLRRRPGARVPPRRQVEHYPAIEP